MILQGGPGKIYLPDGTEIDVMFEETEVNFAPVLATHACVTLTKED